MSRARSDELHRQLSPHANPASSHPNDVALLATSRVFWFLKGASRSSFSPSEFAWHALYVGMYLFVRGRHLESESRVRTPVVTFPISLARYGLSGARDALPRAMTL